MSKFALGVLALLVLVVGGRFIYGIVNKPDDKTMIQQALADAVQASKEGRSGSVIDKIADNFNVNGEHPGRQQIADIVRKNHPEVEIQNTDPVITGDSAQITSDVTVKLNVLGSEHDLTFKDAQLVFTKEAGTDWLIIPATKWRLSAARVSESDLSGLNYP